MNEDPATKYEDQIAFTLRGYEQAAINDQELNAMLRDALVNAGLEGHSSSWESWISQLPVQRVEHLIEDLVHYPGRAFNRCIEPAEADRAAIRDVEARLLECLRSRAPKSPSESQ